VAFLRVTRDKRGYEHFYLLESLGRNDRARTRILYWFRTPPGVRVGRTPFDDPLKRALEAQYPGVSFDWKKIESTPVPPVAPDVEHWRERRKAERAAKQAAREEARAEAAVEAATALATEPTPFASKDETAVAGPVEQTGNGLHSPRDGAGRRKRRRRRRGGRRPDDQAAAEAGPAQAADPGEPSEPRDP
jgi:hypothetical protein